MSELRIAMPILLAKQPKPALNNSDG